MSIAGGSYIRFYPAFYGPSCSRQREGGVGGAFTFACTAWWRVIYLLCLVVSRLKGVLVIWPDSRRERKRRIGYPYRSCRTSAPLFSGSGAEIAPDGHIQWRRAHWCLWAICYETKAASWRRSIDDDNPSDNEGSSQFLTGRLHGLNLKIDDWCDITELEQEKWGPALKKQTRRRSTCLQEVTWPRWIETAKWKRSRAFQKNTETTLCERSSDSISLSIYEVHEEQSWKWRLHEMNDKIPDRWKKTCWIWMDLLPDLDLMSPVVQAEVTIQRQAHNAN